MRSRAQSRTVLVGYSADEALDRLRGDPAPPVRVRWLLDASTTAALHAVLMAKQGTAVSRTTFVDSFHGSDDLPALGWWLRRRDTDGSADAITWCMRVVRGVSPRRDDADDKGCGDASDRVEPRDTDGRGRTGYDVQGARGSVHEQERGRHRARVYNDIDDDDNGRLVAMVAPESNARDLSTLCLGLYARLSVSRTTYHVPADPGAVSGLCVVVDRVALGGSGAGSVVLQGTAVARDPVAARRLVDVLAAAGVDTARAPPPSKVAAYLARRRPALYTRLVHRGALDASP
ncbi:hypothetical protein psal_cds_1266 [Pandoravirus salinus]|uniref:Uncharacterized protein n=1 Tax=Pandoravirus salinus TaxID=1349410 RepID=S4VZ30_9VIRU|nr:hypothetical protein psal_cds_1266 [Pandoravirus salinus]AGO85613.1 hypothetical protein psal_cds_1266 [Pandoravirus salinus]